MHMDSSEDLYECGITPIITKLPEICYWICHWTFSSPMHHLFSRLNSSMHAWDRLVK